MINFLRRSQRKHHGGRDGGAVAIEFALLMAFLPLPILALGIVDYGEMMAQATSLSAIVRGAAEYARGQVVLGRPLPQPRDLDTLLGVPAAVFTPSPPSSFCTCADGSTPPPLPTCPTSLPVAPTNPCAVSPPANGDLRVLKYVEVSGMQTYTPIISGIWSFPEPIQRQTVLRTQ